MNERIRLLAEQAGFFPEINYDHTGWHAAGHNELFEKFAELIVRECAKRTEELGQPEIGQGLMKHFGVEE